MTPQDVKRLNQALDDLAALYPRTDIPPATILAYCKRLSDLPLPAVLAAIDRIGNTSTFFPSVAEIRQSLGEDAAGADATAEESWTHIAAEIRRCGYNRPRIFHRGEWIDPPTPVFRTETERDAVESLGWAFLCTGETAEVRKQYIFPFRTLRQRDIKRVQTGDVTAADPLPVRVVPEITQKAAGD